MKIRFFFNLMGCIVQIIFHNLIFSSNFTIIGGHKMLITLILFYSRVLILNCLEIILKLRQFLVHILEHIIYVFVTLYYVWNVYRHMRKKSKPVRSENLPSGQIFFKKGLFWLVWGNSFHEKLCLTLYIHYTNL